MSSQTTTAPASRPNLQERGRRAEQQEINLHENPQSRNPQGAMKHGTVGNPTFHRRVENRENASGKRRYHQNRPRKPQPGERKTNSCRRVDHQHGQPHPHFAVQPRFSHNKSRKGKPKRDGHGKKNQETATRIANATSGARNACHRCQTCHSHPTDRGLRHAIHPSDVSWQPA